jgi:hypothetical protein
MRTLLEVTSNVLDEPQIGAAIIFSELRKIAEIAVRNSASASPYGVIAETSAIRFPPYAETNPGYLVGCCRCLRRGSRIPFFRKRKNTS